MLKPLAKIKNIKSPIITISFVIVFLLICSVALGIVLYDHYSKPEQPVLANFEITSTSSSSFRIVNNGGDTINFDENVALILESEGQIYELNSSVIKVLKSGETYEVDLTQQPYAVKISPGKKVTVKVVDSTKDSVILEEEVIVADGNNTSSDSSIYNKNNTTNNSVSTEESSALSIIDSSINNSNTSSYDLEYVSNISSTEDTQNSSGMTELSDPYLSNSTASDDNAQLDSIGINSDAPEEESEEGPTVLFIDSLENPIAGGVVQYYKGGWKDFGITDSDGKITQILDDGIYTFRLTYANSSKNIRQDIRLDNKIEFQTVNTTVTLADSNNNVIDTDAATVQYYAAGWKTLGTTSHGTVQKELLPSNYTFRLTYSNVSKNMRQDIGIDNTVDFRTSNALVSLYDSNNNVIDTNAATVQYYAAGWKTLGTTSHGTVQKELLPTNYTFRLTYSNVSKNMRQDIGIDNTVDFQTGKAVYLFDTCTYYYASGWKTFTNGMELMPGEYSFKYSDKTSRKYTITADKTTYIDRVLSI